MKTIVVTGGSRGIGRGLARSFLERGCKVVLTSRSTDGAERAAKELATEVAGSDERVLGVACDVTDPASVEALWEAAVERFGSVDVFVNNAGMSIPRGHIWEAETDDLHAIVDTNLLGPLLVAKVVIGAMVHQGHGQLWLMEGFGSDGTAQPGIAPYGATKRGVNYLVKALAKDTEETPVQVCALSPGIVITDLLLDDYVAGTEAAERAHRIFKILGDRVETVTPWLADQVLATDKTGSKVAWLTRGKAAGRFMTAWRGRDPFTPEEATRLTG
jgi:NAD(P)-dependent dehydrogenase (short-subunit alcohol dehydrogenase family)